jgi:restriction endonuclease S subunit
MLSLNLLKNKVLIFGDEKMAVFSIVKLSETNNHHRLDSEFYHPTYLENKRRLTNLKIPLFSLKQCSNYITNGHTPRYADLTTGEVYFLTAEDILDFIVNFETSKRITKEDSHKVLRRTILQENDLLLTIKGKIGNAAVIYKLKGETNINQDVARIILKKTIGERKINPYFIAAFINSKFGRLQVEQLATSQINPFLGLYNLKQIVIPLLSEKFQNKIEDVIKKALKFFYDSYFIFSQAETLLLEELGLKDFKPKFQKTYAAKLSSALFAHRMDAEYFQPAYKEVIEKVINYPGGFSKLLMLAENVKPDFDPTKYPEKTFSYVELADINSSIGVIYNVNETKGGEAPSRARRILKEGDVIVSRVEGSLEKVALVDKEHDGCLASTGFFQFRPLNILPEVLLVLSKTIVLQLQLKKKSSGTILTAIPKESLRDVVIPILPLLTQEKIASLIKQSHAARREAIKLIEIAKRTIEIAIERGEEEGYRYLSEKGIL